MLKIIRNTILILILIGFISAFSLAAFLINKGYKSLPDVAKLVEEYSPIEPTIIYDVNGEVVNKVFKENREIVKIEEVPEHVRNAFLAIEDKKFMKHYGFDFLRLLKSFATAPKYLLQRRNIPGGSTITQQLAKNAFLTNERKIMRKVKEAILAVEIERRYTKEEILEKYINEIYFGEGAHGVSTAAKKFFNKKVKDLTIAEAAFLAGLPNRPAIRYNEKKLERAKKRQRLVLYQMNNFGFISNEEYAEAKKVEIALRRPKSRNYKAPSYTNIVTSKIFDMFGEEVYEAGYRIYTAMDLRYQKIAEEVFNASKYLNDENYEGLEGALITINSDNGYVKAVVGGKDFKSGNFNRAVMAKRQPGSSFKPFIYYSLLRNDLPMNVIVENSPLKFGEWEPKNYNGKFDGNLTILEGLEDSVNIVAIKLLKRVAIKNAVDTARKAGITSKIPYNLTAALGTLSLSPFELASAYIPFSNGGYSVEPIFITKIEDRYGKTIYEAKQNKKEVFDKETIALLVHMMENVVKNGSGKKAYAGVQQAGKTGTTNDSTNAWFSGFTPDFVTTLYLGYDTPKKIKYGTGGGFAAPVWGDYVKRLIKEGIYKPTKFDFIEDILRDKRLVYEMIDIENGLLVDKSTIEKRKALFKRWQTPVEKAGKYKAGLGELLPKEKNQEDGFFDNILNSLFDS